MCILSSSKDKPSNHSLKSSTYHHNTKGIKEIKSNILMVQKWTKNFTRFERNFKSEFSSTSNKL